MSKKIHTCYTDVELSSTMSVSECNSECENIDLSKIGTLSEEDHSLYESDISKSHYHGINQITEPNLYENMILEDSSDTTENFDTNDDKFFRELDDNDKISLNLLNENMCNDELPAKTTTPTPPETANNQDDLSNNAQDEYHDVNIEDIEIDASFQGNINLQIILIKKDLVSKVTSICKLY